MANDHRQNDRSAPDIKGWQRVTSLKRRDPLRGELFWVSFDLSRHAADRGFMLGVEGNDDSLKALQRAAPRCPLVVHVQNK
jgi:hypothetical protein